MVCAFFVIYPFPRLPVLFNVIVTGMPIRNFSRMLRPLPNSHFFLIEGERGLGTSELKNVGSGGKRQSKNSKC